MADGRDFFDEDLIKHRDEIKRIKMGPADEPARKASPDPAEDGGAAGGDFNLTSMMQRKEEMAGDTAKTTEELERLRNRQNDLEQQKKDLETMRERISKYEAGKQEMLEKIAQSIISLEKQEVKATTFASLLETTRERFKALQDELQMLDESSWEESDFREELSKALTTVDNARMEFNKSIASIESASNEQKDPSAETDYEHVVFDQPGANLVEEKTFGDWLKIGLAASLPLVIVLSVIAILILIYFAKSGYFGWF